MSSTTLMRREMLETPERLAAQWAANRDAITAIAADLAARPNAPWWVTARGSSSHAGAFFAAAAGLGAGRVVGEITPSLFTVYGRKPMLAGAVVMAISQSGAGSDINAVVEAANATGALTLALTNDPESRLAATAAHTLDLAMGPEKAVAATKTYLGTLAAAARLVATVADDHELEAALERLPATLAHRRDNQAPLDASALAAFDSAGFVLGRGVSLGIAREVALKFKEVCVTPAEAFSAAEFIHGPLTLVGRGTPVLIICLDDATRPGLIDTAHRLAELEANVTLLGPGLEDVTPAEYLSVVSRPATGNVYTDAIAMAFDCYGALEARAVALGYDPDQPPNVRKVTSTY
ncbi:SIS domain-containing protein [Salinisphaera sp. LB1]|uniref:SIS domain-containing protein n=1 Tax=Salinisphaera sp. LB1 TaxID=2183911 RepID=UPI000D7054DA|nr:SIS domain-containing protein [Salinisphaera sp. LB1]AWN15035.1 Glucosamine-6-phosphate deaminase [isomerizing], alternative [Salinisphaera sp. LB1]